MRETMSTLGTVALALLALGCASTVGAECRSGTQRPPLYLPANILTCHVPRRHGDVQPNPDLAVSALAQHRRRLLVQRAVHRDPRQSHGLHLRRRLDRRALPDPQPSTRQARRREYNVHCC